MRMYLRPFTGLAALLVTGCMTLPEPSLTGSLSGADEPTKCLIESGPDGAGLEPNLILNLVTIALPACRPGVKADSPLIVAVAFSSRPLATTASTAESGSSQAEPIAHTTRASLDTLTVIVSDRSGRELQRASASRAYRRALTPATRAPRAVALARMIAGQRAAAPRP